jgi:Tol biopolymer transport system component
MKAGTTGLNNCILTLLIFFLSQYIVNGQSGKNTFYPSTQPGSVAIPFLPGIVSKDAVDFGAAFSPGGESFLFARKQNNQTKIYISRYDNGEWKEPALFPYTDSRFSEADPAFAPDGKLYFISNRPKNSSDSTRDYDIWFITPLGDTGWSDPENMKEINSDSSEFYISFSENGNLYFSSSRKGGFGEEDIYVSRFLNKKYTMPENLGATINSVRSEYDPFISPNEDFIVFASSGRDDSFGGADLYCSKLNSKREWLQAINLGKDFNTKTREYCPYLTKDRKYFFFSSEGDVKWIDSGSLKKQIDKL